MATRTTRRRAPTRTTFTSGPHNRVLATNDPFDGAPTDLVAARNVYNPSPMTGAGFQARPGLRFLNGGNPLYVGVAGVPFRGQCVYTHFDSNAVPYNFAVFGGHLFAVDATFTATDVTPVGVTIDASASTRVYMASMNGVLCVSDGVNRPWVASDLTSTPITGTYIDFDGMGTTWSAFGAPVVFGGSGFFILNQVNSNAARLDIAWSQPNDWTTGYQQTDFDNRWTLEQTGSTPIYALAGTNVALYYWRGRSIGAIAGTVGPDLATTATHDAISQNVGTMAPQSVVQFGNTIFFIDVTGRPWQFNLGSPPVDIWQQLRGTVDVSNTGYPSVTAIVATATFEPTLNLYCVAIWSPSPGAEASPVEWHTFDAQTGHYFGPWSIGPTDPGTSVDCMGSWIDANGRPTFVVLGSAVPGGASGYAWGLNALHAIPDFITTEDGDFLTTEDGRLLTTEGQADVWADNGELPLIFCKTQRLGYDINTVYSWDMGTVLCGTQSPINFNGQTTTAAALIEGTATPARSADGIYRSVFGLDIQGRGISVTLSPRNVDAQWTFQQVQVVGIPSMAMPEDQ